MGTNVRRSLVGLFGVIVIVASACGSTSESDQAQELWDDYQAARDAGEAEAMVALVSEDMVWENPLNGDRREGRAAFQNLVTWVIRVTDTDRTTIVDQFVSEDGTRVVWSEEWIGTTDLGADFALHPTHVYEVENGEFVSGTILFADADGDVIEQLTATG